MPDTRGRPLPSEILASLKDPAVTNWLRSFLISTTSSESIGRYPGNGSAQNDIYVYPDAADSTHPYNFDYVIASNFQRLISAKLSFKVRAYRTYNTITGTNTGAGTNHAHGIATEAIGESGHSHNHAHSMTIQSGAAAATLDWLGTGITTTNVGGPFSVNPAVDSNANGSSGHTHNHGHGSVTGGEASHTHALNLSQTLGITEGAAPVNPGITVAVDGTDVTTSLAGPFNTDKVELDVTKVLKTSINVWHTLTLQPNQNVRITGILRVSYYVDNRLAI